MSVPIIATLKRDLHDSRVRITPNPADVHALADTRADIMAYDTTDLPRPETTKALVAAINEGGALALADCSTLEDARRAMAQGATITGTTLAGYTNETEGKSDGIDFDLMRAFRNLDAFVMAVGWVNTPDLAGRRNQSGRQCGHSGHWADGLKV